MRQVWLLLQPWRRRAGVVVCVALMLALNLLSAASNAQCSPSQ
jgi:hypothetical protein